MPQATLSAARLFDRLGRNLTAAALEELLFCSKAELAEFTGDELKIEATADRIDLLSETGLAEHLAGRLGLRHGRPAMTVGSRLPEMTIEVDPSVRPLRPAIAGVLVEAPDAGGLTAEFLEEAVHFQELLHATVGRGRRLASLGLYPLSKFEPPVRYALEPLAGIRFRPLDADVETDGTTFFGGHPMAAKYGDFGRVGDRALTLKDRTGRILSLPPVLNARPAGEARPGDTQLLLESTGTLLGRVEDALGLLLHLFVARGWGVRGVRVADPGGPGEGRTLLDPRPVRLTEPTLKAVLGETLPAAEVAHDLAVARLSAHSVAGGWEVDVPPWRPDLLAEVDLAEDVALARGLTTETAVVPPTLTRGRRRDESRFRGKVASVLLGLGFTPLFTPVMVGESVVDRLGRTDAVAVANPVSELYSHLRDRILVSLATSLERNVRHGYPQRLSEVGPVIVRDPSAEAGALTRYHAGAVLATDRAGFADGAALVDYLLGALGTVGVREPVELPGTIPGRAARVRLAGETVAEVAEIHPRVLVSMGVPVPVVWAELDLSTLYPLLGAP